ncbi:MAG: hypothetical protein ACXAEN_24670 [Candidatus Thorarchaeota archaeon]|jgi:hypothetical protein
MAQDTYSRYTGTGRPVNEMGHTTPQVEFSESERPAVGMLPAPYVPAGRFDEHKRSKIVFSAGIPVALDGLGNLVPAGIPGGHTFVYTALDFRVGLPATRNASTGVVIASAGNATMHSGLTNETVGDFLRPIGITSYLVYQHEGQFAGTWPAYTLGYDNPVNYAVHNTMAQDLVAVTCDYTIQVPYIYGKNLLGAATKIFDNTADEVAALTSDAQSYPFAHDELMYDATTIVSGTISNIDIVYASPNQGLGDDGDFATALVDFATLTSGTTGLQYTAPGSSTAGTAVTFATIDAGGNQILYDGDDTSMYIVVRNPRASTLWALPTSVAATQPHEDAGLATVSAANVYFYYKLNTTLQPGDFVVSREGRYVKYDKTRHEKDEILGQVLRRDDNPVAKDYLDRVKTAYERSTSVVHKMAGSATRGVPYLLNLVTDAAQVQFATNQTLAGDALATAGQPTSLPLSLVVINVLR